ncbi:MAG TPA: biotin--[acetyl-CoA-carboxylase] ligase [Vicinamibacterales bacterium]|nr:biotin--[acetyl-CoA-carboxylase] ligase [Vicinamibacterales bacterium]
MPRHVPPEVVAAMSRVSPRAGAMGRSLHWLDSTTSTNDVAARLAESGAEEGTTVVAETQTAGRGRHGRIWFSPPGAGLYISTIVRPGDAMTGNANPATLLTIASGVAIAEAVHAVTGLPAQIKWPNDVIIGRRKLAGILAEGALQAGALHFVVVGVGVNLQTSAYPPELASRVTSIEAETTRPPDRAVMLAEVLAAMGERYADLRAGRFDAILTAWRRLAASLPGADVEWESPAGVVRGRAQDIDRDGALLVQVAGKIERVVAGEVRWLSVNTF